MNDPQTTWHKRPHELAYISLAPLIIRLATLQILDVISYDPNTTGSRSLLLDSVRLITAQSKHPSYEGQWPQKDYAPARAPQWQV